MIISGDQIEPFVAVDVTEKDDITADARERSGDGERAIPVAEQKSRRIQAAGNHQVGNAIAVQIALVDRQGPMGGRHARSKRQRAVRRPEVARDSSGIVGQEARNDDVGMTIAIEVAHDLPERTLPGPVNARRQEPAASPAEGGDRAFAVEVSRNKIRRPIPIQIFDRGGAETPAGEGRPSRPERAVAVTEKAVHETILGGPRDQIDLPVTIDIGHSEVTAVEVEWRDDRRSEAAVTPARKHREPGCIAGGFSGEVEMAISVEIGQNDIRRLVQLQSQDRRQWQESRGAVPEERG